MGQKYSAEKLSVGLPGFLPAARRRCMNCRKVMKPCLEWRDAKEGEPGVKRFVNVEVPVRVMYYGYSGANLFCSLRCGYAYGCRAARAQGAFFHDPTD